MGIALKQPTKRVTDITGVIPELPHAPGNLLQLDGFTEYQQSLQNWWNNVRLRLGNEFIKNDQTVSRATSALFDDGINTLSARITEEAVARADADAALAYIISTITAAAGTSNAIFVQTSAPSATNINDIWYDSDDGFKRYYWSGSAWVENTDARLTAAISAISSESSARASADSAMAVQITALISDVGDNTADIATIFSTYATEAFAEAKKTEAISAAGAHTDAEILSEETARISGDSAEATARTTLEASLRAGSRNRLLNSSLEVDSNNDGLADYYDVYNNGGLPVITSLGNQENGGFFQRIDFTAAGSDTQGIIFNDVPAANPNWEPYKTYVISWYARAAGSGQAGYTFDIYWNTAPSSQTALLNPATINGTWQRYAFRITWGASVEAYGRAFIALGYTNSKSGAIDFDDFQVTEGPDLVPYSIGNAADLHSRVTTESSARATADGYLEGKYALKVIAGNVITGMNITSSTGSGTDVSEINFLTSVFKVTDNTTFKAPFQIVGGKVRFTADVEIDGALVLGGTLSLSNLSGRNTSALSDDANLGGTAAWSGVSGVGKPADYADVTLSAVNGGLNVTGGGITLSGGGSIKGGATDFLTGTGFFLGYSGGQYKFSVGDPAGAYIAWNGSTWTVNNVVPAGVAGSFDFGPANINGTTYASQGSTYISSLPNLNRLVSCSGFLEGDAASTTVDLEIRRDSTVLLTKSYTVPAFSIVPFTMMVVDTGGAGSFTFYLYGKNGSSSRYTSCDGTFIIQQ